MRRINIPHVELTKAELRRISDLASMCLVPFKDKVDETLNPLTQLNKLTCGGQRIWKETEKDDLILYLGKTQDYIRSRIVALQEDLDNNSVPENSDGIIARPKDMYQHMIDNYNHQWTGIAEIAKVFLVETDDDEDEYTP